MTFVPLACVIMTLDAGLVSGGSWEVEEVSGRGARESLGAAHQCTPLSWGITTLVGLLLWSSEVMH